MIIDSNNILLFALNIKPIPTISQYQNFSLNQEDAGRVVYKLYWIARRLGLDTATEPCQLEWSV